MVDLSTRYMGLTLINPLIAGSSGLTNSLQDVVDLVNAGAGAIVLKSLFEEEIRHALEKDMKKMSAEGFLYPETLDYYDQYDVEDTLTSYLKLIRDCKKNVQVPIMASINCVTAQKWPYYAGTLQEAGADALELNAFILPSNFSATSEENEKTYFDIAAAVQKEVSIPVAMKISHYSAGLAGFIQRLSNTGIRGLVLFNRFYSPDIDLDRMEVIATHVHSSPSDLALSLRWIAMMYGRVGCSLAASTGVHDGKAVVKQLLAGADAVQVVSALYKNGIRFIGTMLKELTAWMEEKGFASIDQFRGQMSYQKAANPAAYERVQFMKHFSGK
jgi:dihydroorotate dehydrogenase (fumarate)